MFLPRAGNLMHTHIHTTYCIHTDLVIRNKIQFRDLCYGVILFIMEKDFVQSLPIFCCLVTTTTKYNTTHTHSHAYISLILSENCINIKVAEEYWPFTLNILKDFQFCWFIIQTTRILQKHKYVNSFSNLG